MSDTMRFTVHSAAEAKRKVALFAELFESEPTGVTISGLFESQRGDWISAWENDPHSRIHVISFKRVWIRAYIAELVDIRPLESTFQLYLY